MSGGGTRDIKVQKKRTGPEKLVSGHSWPFYYRNAQGNTQLKPGKKAINRLTELGKNTKHIGRGDEVKKRVPQKRQSY